MKERGFRCTDVEVRAILAGLKTQTRLVLKSQEYSEERRGSCFIATYSHSKGYSNIGGGEQVTRDEFARKFSPYGTVGDRLWVREAFAWTVDTQSKSTIVYRADHKKAHVMATLGGQGDPIGTKPTRARTYPVADLYWRPSIHMPRWASRITLEIAGIRVARLQDISDQDAKAEGAARECESSDCDFFLCHDGHLTYREGFRQLWDSVNAKRGHSWESNPWVWIVKFKRITEAA